MLFYVHGSSYPKTDPHKILTQLFQHGSVSEIGHKFRAELAISNITTFQHPLNSKNLCSSDKTVSTLLKTKHSPYLVQNP
jgi:hypothetical protein